jgi:hypothetical protein
MSLRKYKNFMSPANWAQYIEYKKRAKQMVKCSVRKFMHTSLDSKSLTSKQLWSNLKKFNLVEDKLSNQPLAVSVNELVDKFTLTVNLSCPLLHANITYYNSSLMHANDKFYFKDISPLEIQNHINSISSNAIGEDGIAIKMIKPLSVYLLPVLSHIYNFSLQYSCFPDIWKRALIRPVPKTYKPGTVNDYRPISILSVFAKIFEKIIYTQIMDYVNTNNIIDKCQSGFRKLHSTGTALLKVVEDARLALGRGEITILVLFDFSKAFDCVNHDVLLSKLHHMGFSHSALTWMTQYLKGRSHCVLGPTGSSYWKELNCGVPQGSVLGPLLYILYTFDIGRCFLNCHYHLYADDLQIYLHCKPTEIQTKLALINEDIVRLVNWSNKHGLSINATKTQAMIIHKQSQSIYFHNIDKIFVDGTPIEYCSKVKNLGIIIDEKLTWNQQVSAICQKTYFILHRLYKFRSQTPIETRKRLVSTLILPIFDYCLFVCCNMSDECVNRLQVAQNNAMRYIFSVKPREHISPYYIKLQWLKIKERINLQIYTMTHKILHGYAPEYLQNMFIRMADIHSRQTRAHSLYLLAPQVGKAIPDRSFTVFAYRLWNTLSADICSIKNTALFTNKIECKLLS